LSLYASPEVLPLLERWAAARRDHPHPGGPDMFRFLADKRLEYLRPHNWHSMLSDQAMLVRDFRLVLSVSRPRVEGAGGPGAEVQYLERTREAVRGVLAAAGLPARTMDAGAFVSFLDTVLNPRVDRRARLRWDETRLLADQMVDAGTLLLVGRDGLALGQGDLDLDVWLFSVRQYPQAWAGWGMGDLVGDLLSNTLRVPCPFLYTLTVHVPDQTIAAHGARLKAARATQMADSPMGRFLPAWRERRQDWDYVNRMLEGGHKLLKANFQVVLFARQGEGDHAAQRLNALFESKGWTLQSDDRFSSRVDARGEDARITDWCGRGEACLHHRSRSNLPCRGRDAGGTDVRSTMKGAPGK